MGFPAEAPTGEAELARELRSIAQDFAPAVLASSLSAEDMVLTDAIAREGLPIGIFVLDTGRLHGDTLALVERIRSRYRLGLEVFHPDPVAVVQYVKNYGRDAFYRDTD